MRVVAILIGVSLAFMALVPFASYDVSAAAELQHMRVDSILSSDATFFSDIENNPQALNKNATDRVWTDSDDEDNHWWDAYPGCVLWGDANSATDGNFGTAEVRFTLMDLVGESSAYYYMRIALFVTITQGDPPEENMPPTLETDFWSFRIGFGYRDADTGTAENLNQTYNQLETSTGTPWETQSSQVIWEHEENDQLDRPYTADEVNNMYCVVQMRFDPQGWGYINDYGTLPINLGLAYCGIDAVPTDYTPEDITTGGFILRPNEDIFVTGYENYSADDYEDMYGALNDTNQHGDADQSYVNASWSKSALLELGFTDPPAWAADTEYKVVFWCIIRQTETGLGTVRELTMGLVPDQREKYRTTFYPTTSYTNNTYASDFVPGGSEYWSLLELEEIKAFFSLTWTGDDTPTGEFRMTQAAFLVTPIVPGDYVPDTDDFTDVTFQEWIASGGVFTILALMGGIGLIAGAPIAIIFFKNDRTDGVGALGMAVGIIFVSLCFLLAGLSPYM